MEPIKTVKEEPRVFPVQLDPIVPVQAVGNRLHPVYHVQRDIMPLRKEVLHVKGVPPVKRPTQTTAGVNRHKWVVSNYNTPYLRSKLPKKDRTDKTLRFIRPA